MAPGFSRTCPEPCQLPDKVSRKSFSSAMAAEKVKTARSRAMIAEVISSPIFSKGLLHRQERTTTGFRQTYGVAARLSKMP